ncbi:MAG: glycosyltransferase [Aridibacter sp.]
MLIFYFFAAIQIFFAYKSLRGGIDYQTYFKNELAKPKSDYTPFASVIVPCRGIDIDLAENLEALFEQDYPEFEVIFVVDDENDEAVPIIENISGKSAKLIVAGKAENCGQKVHNLRKAVLEISDKSEVFVFVDSDARPDKHWLKNLIAPLENEKIGCATGYRWFVQKSGGFATHLRSVWNASIASALGQNTKNNFCWGGSTAIRREIFEQLNVREKWRGTVSDDFALTNILQKAEVPIYFVPSCLTATVEDCTFSELLEFTTRQMKITRVYSPNHFTISLIGSILSTFTFWTGIFLLFFISGVHCWIVL